MKKLLSILGAMGLVATASSGVVACSSSFASGSIDVDIDKAEGDSVTGKNFSTFANELDAKINDANGYYKFDNDLAARMNKTEAGSKDWTAIANKVVIAIYKVKGNFYLGTQEFYKEAVDNFLANSGDQATTRNKIEVSVQMTSLWSLLNVKGTADKDYGTKLQKLFTTDKDNLNFVMQNVAEEFGTMKSADLDKALQKPKADLKGVKLEVNFHLKDNK